MKRLNWVFITLIFPALTLADDQKSTRLFFETSGSVYRSSNQTQQNAVGIGAILSHGIRDHWGVELGLRQDGSTQSLSAVSTSLRAHMVYAVTGNLRQVRKKTEINGVILADEITPYRSGLRAVLGGAQFFFSGSTATVAFSGISAGLRYEFKLWNQVLFVSPQAQFLKNGQNSIQTFGLSLGLIAFDF